MNSLDYLKAQKKDCCLCGRSGELHHLDNIGMGRDRKKPLKEHYSVIGLCRLHHTEIHTIGVRNFEDRYGVNLWREAHSRLIDWVER